MKFKLKMSRKRLTVVGIVVLLVAGLLVARHRGAGDNGPGPMDADAARACTDFANGYPHARTKADRLVLADKVSRSSMHSDNHTINDRATEVGRSAGDSTTQWKASANALTNACQSAGWRS